MGVIALALVLSVLSTPTVVLGAEYSLGEVYHASLSKTETNAIEEARVAQLQEKVSQAKGSFFPTISGIASYQRQDETGSSSSISRANQKNARITAVQPIFRGSSEFYGLSAVQAQLRAQEQSRLQAKITLARLVAEAFYDVLGAAQDVQNVKTLQELTQDRIRELKRRVKIGRSRKGDLLAAESQALTTEAQLELANDLHHRAWETLIYVSGIERGSTLKDTEDLRAIKETVDEYLSKIEDRPDIQAKKELLNYYDDSVGVTRGFHFPSVDATGNYYLKRSGLLEDSKWDVTLTLTIPFFQGGVTQSQVREASEKRKEQELTLFSGRREVQKEIRIFYESVQSGLKQVKMLKEAVALSEQNYKEQSKDYSLGLVTNLEVLQALNSFIENQRALDRSRYDLKTSHAFLRTAVGDLP